MKGPIITVRLGVVLTALLALLLAAAALLAYWLFADLPSLSKVISQRQHSIMQEQNSTKVLAADEKTVILQNGRYVVEPVPITAVSKAFIKALVATEDRRFYLHRGVDPMAIVRALWRNAKGHKLQEGGSTLTQQLARQLFLSNERSLTRKIKEMVLAYQLEQELTKDQILELYMNHIYFGQGAYGVEMAANVFFSKSAKDLTLIEAAFLAGLPQAPSSYNPLVNPKLAKARRNEVLQNLLEVGALSSKELKELSSKELGIKPNLQRLAIKNNAPYFNQVVQQQVMDWFGLSEQEFWQGGYRIITTLNPTANTAAHEAIGALSKQYKRQKTQEQLTLVAMNPETGAVQAYESGRDFYESQYDRAQKSRRSPGSLFKVFTYTEAIRQGFSPNQVVVDEPITFGRWKPENFDHKHHGPMSLARALATSNNVVAVKLMDSVGVDNVANLAKQMGINSPIEANLSTTLGGSSVYLTEMVRAFGVFANGGYKVKPYLIERIEDIEGNIIYKNKEELVPVLPKAVASTMANLLASVVSSGTGRGALYGKGSAAGKTGTSDQNRDAWFIGFAPGVVAGVWAGNDDNTPMPATITGGSLPAQTWSRFMFASAAALKPKHSTLAEAKPLLPVPSDNQAPVPGGFEGGGTATGLRQPNGDPYRPNNAGNASNTPSPTSTLPEEGYGPGPNADLYRPKNRPTSRPIEEETYEPPASSAPVQQPMRRPSAPQPIYRPPVGGNNNNSDDESDADAMAPVPMGSLPLLPAALAVA